MAKIMLTASDGFNFAAHEAKAPAKPRGGIVVLQEIFGMNPHMRSVADGYATEGYHVIAPGLFERAERNVAMGYDKADTERGIALRAKVPLAQTLLDIEASIMAVSDAGKVAIVGFCWGGSLAWLGAARLPGLSASVGYYGGMIAGSLGETPRMPVMLHFGEKDGGIPLSDVDKIRAGTDPAIVQVFTYPAGHAFNRDGTANYHADSAKLARTRTMEFLRKHVG